MFNKEKLYKYIPLSILLVFVYSFYMWHLGYLPITAYDESIYAQITRDTLNSGQIMTLLHINTPWFEKPPLYFWLSMPMVKIFGDVEISHRLVSAISAIFSILFTFLITKKLTNKKYLAILSSFILAIIPFFYITSRQVRLDTPLTMFMLAALYFLIIGWRKEKFLIAVLPILGLGFMTKSLAIFTAIAILIIFSIIYKKFNWLKNKWLWFGFLISLIIVLPWHIYQHIIWGSDFWHTYISWNIWQRINGGFGNQESINYLEYFKKLWLFTYPWWQIFILTIPTFIILNKIRPDKKTKKIFLASLSTTLVVILLFSISKTKISTYLIPAYPYMAIVIGLTFYKLWQITKNYLLKILYIIIFGFLSIYSIILSIGYNDKILKTLHYYLDPDLKEIGVIIKEDDNKNTPLYFLNGPMPDVVGYYSGHPIKWISLAEDNNKYNIEGPVYIMLTDYTFAKIFTKDGHQIKNQYLNMRLKYIKDHIILLYTKDNIILDL